uniref:Putative kinesin n=1 Tax=Trypanosoma congolense (strain IL3000) TaxID=1068625 RepID=G0US87_TRYCI|nr:putative kinesin [Trypanosoma congolense IL3000]
MELRRCNSSRTAAGNGRPAQPHTSATTTSMRSPASARTKPSSAKMALTPRGEGGSVRSASRGEVSLTPRAPGLPRPEGYKRSGTPTSVGPLHSSDGMSVVSSVSGVDEGFIGKGKGHKIVPIATGGNGRVNVYARVRAFSSAEAGEKKNPAVRMIDNRVEVIVPPKSLYTFNLDGCFCSCCPPSDDLFASQQDVFNAVGYPLTESALAGYNTAIMVYGQTGSGKTYTMFGPPDSLGTEEQGLVPRICNMVFERANSSLQKGITYRVRVSMLEVYLEDVFDLFNNRKQVTVRKNYMDNSFQVVGAKSIPVRHYKDVKSLLKKAEAQRTFAPTAIHSRSSRAHALFQLELYTTFESADIAPRTAKILLADLAGCERIKVAKTETGVPFEEARNINLSLLSLGSCIEAVAARKGSNQIISEFRNSTLTKLLKEFLGGNSLSSIIVTVGPSTSSARLSVQSLRLADRAMKVTTHAKINTVKPVEDGDLESGLSEGHREAYTKKKEALQAEFQVQNELHKLQSKIALLETQLMNSTDDEVVARLNEEIADYQKSLAEADAQLMEQRRILYANEVMLEEQLKELNMRMQEMREDHEESIENIMIEGRKRCQELVDAERKRYDDELDVLMKKHEKDIDRLNQLLQRSDEKNAQLTASLIDAKEELRKADTLVDEMQLALEELGESSRTNEAELQGHVELLRGENCRLHQEMKSLQATHAEDTARRTEERCVLESELGSLRLQLNEMEERDVRIRELMDLFRVENCRLHQEMKSLQATHAEDTARRTEERCVLESELGSLRLQLNEMEERDVRIRELMDLFRVENCRLHQEMKSLQATHAEDTARRTEERCVLESELGSLRLQLNEMEERDVRIRELMDLFRVENCRLHQEMKSLQATHAEDTARRTEERCVLESELGSLRLQLNEMEERDVRIRELMDLFRVENCRLHQEMKSLQATHAEDTARRTEERCVLESELGSLRLQLKETEKELLNCKEDLQRSEADLAKSNARCEELINELQVAREHMRSTYQCLQVMQRRAGDAFEFIIEVYSRKYEEAVSSFSSLAEALAEDLTKSVAERLRLLAEMMNLRASTVTVKASNQRRMSTIVALVQSAQDTLLKVICEAEEADALSETPSVATLHADSPKPKTSFNAESSSLLEGSLAC